MRNMRPGMRAEIGNLGIGRRDTSAAGALRPAGRQPAVWADVDVTLERCYAKVVG